MKLTGIVNTLLLGGALVVPTFSQTSGTPGSSGQTGTTGSGQQSESQKSQTDTDKGRKTGAQSQSGQTSTEHTGHAAGAAGEASAVGKPDHAFMTKAAQGGMMEVQLGQMAQEKASNPQVKEYARKLTEDHQKANEQLKKIAQQRGVPLPSDMGTHNQQVQRLSNVSGEEFDRAFMKMQVDHHKKDIKEFQRHSDRAMDSAVKDFATAQVPVLQEHLKQAEQLAAQTGTRSRKADKSNATSSQEGQGSDSGDKSKPTTQK